VALNHRKGQAAWLHSQVAQYSARVLLCSEEAIAAESFVAGLRSGVTHKGEELGEKAGKQRREMRTSEEGLQVSVSTMKRKWRESQDQSSQHLQRLHSIHSLRKRLHQQQLSHFQLLLHKSLQELLHARIQRAMNNLVGTFGSSDPAVVIEKLEKERSQGEGLQRNADFLLGHVAGLRKTAAALKGKRELAAKQRGGDGKDGLLPNNASSLLILHSQLHSQEQKLRSLNILLSNAHSTLLHLLSRFTSKDRLHILSAGLPIYQHYSLEITLLVFGKTVTMAWEWTVQRRAIWGQRQRTAFVSKLVMGNVLNKRPSLIMREIPRDSLQLLGNRTVPLLPPLSNTPEAEEEIEDMRKQRKDYKRGKAGLQPKNAAIPNTQTERSKGSQNQLRSFAKEIRFVNTTRQHLSSILHAPSATPRFSAQGPSFRASC